MQLAVERLQEVFDSLDYHVAMYDRAWRYTYLNREAARLLGRSPEELLGRSIWEVFPEAVGNQYYRELHEAAATRRAIHSDYYHEPLGRWFENHIYPLPDGVLSLARDITAQKHASETLRERETMLRLAQQAGGVATFEWDFARGVARCSSEFFEMFGLPANEGIIRGEEWSRFVHPADRDMMATHLERALAGDETPSIDYRVITADGRTRWLTYAGQVHRAPTGDVRMLGTVVDITARKEAEEELRRRDERHRAFVNTSTEAIWRFELAEPVPVSWDAGRQVDAFFEHAFLAECNDAMARMYGYTRAEDLVGTRLADLLVPTDDTNRTYLRAFVEAGYRVTGHESHERDRAGRPKFFRNSLVGIVENGAVVRAWGTQADITEQKAAEAQLRESEARFRLMADHAPVLIWLADTRNRATFFNRPWLEFTGAPLEAQIDAGWLACIHPDDRIAAVDTRSRHVERRLPFSLEFRLRRHDGEYRWVLDHGTPLLDAAGAFGGYIGACVDITEVKAAQERAGFLAAAGKALASSLDYRQTLRTVAELALPYLADWCAVDMFTASGGIERLVVAHRDPVSLSSVLEESKRWPPRLEGALAQVAATRRPLVMRRITDEMLSAAARDAEHLAFLRSLGLRSAIVVPFVARDRVLGAITLVLSDSARTYDEGDLSVVEDLAHRAAIAIDNARLYEEAQAASRAKDDFLARLSHELRTPLNAVLGWTLMLRGSGDEARLNRGLDVIDRNARALSHIIEDLLDFSRNVRGGLRIERTCIDLCDVARQAVASVEPLAAGRGIALFLEAVGCVLVSGDPARLQQVVWNLLTNAIKFTPPGGRVSVTVQQGTETAELSVRDSGAGIRPEVMETMFDPFRQGDIHGIPGLGLGLAIVRQIVEAHGGAVTARNVENGPGAVFVVSLPMAERDSRESS